MQNNDLIHRSDLLDHLRAKVCADCYVRKAGGKCGGCFIRAALDMIEDVAVVDAVEMRHGRYGFLGMDMMAGSRAFYFGTCSECRERINFEPNHKNYCPHCGAKMDGEHNDIQRV